MKTVNDDLSMAYRPSVGLIFKQVEITCLAEQFAVIYFATTLRPIQFYNLTACRITTVLHP